MATTWTSFSATKDTTLYSPFYSSTEKKWRREYKIKAGKVFDLEVDKDQLSNEDELYAFYDDTRHHVAYLDILQKLLDGDIVLNGKISKKNSRQPSAIDLLFGSQAIHGH